ncbi:MAG: protein jag [Spirochaetota bacterium]|nr:protein jag [Spirochaetota bacterium]
MLVREFEGKTKKDAIKLALETLNLSEDQIKIEPIDTEKVGFFGFRNKKSVKIKVFYEEQPASQFSLKAKKFLTQLFEIMKLSANVAIIQEDTDKLFLSVASSESGLIIGKRGKNLEAIQFMLNMILNKDKKNRLEWKKIILDIEGYLNKREAAIKRLALKTAEAVRATKKTRLLQAMNPFERRLVHLTLQDFNDIGTRSEGDGIYKKIRVFLK